MGSNAENTDSNTPLKDKYTVYFLFYLKSEDALPQVYFNGEWSHTYPKANGIVKKMDGKNVVLEGALKGKRIQLYCIGNSGYKEHGTFGPRIWGWLRTFK